MLSGIKATKGCYLMVDLVKEIAGDTNAQTARGIFVVSAKVRGELVVDSEPIECTFAIKLDSVDISVYWEEAGYKQYKRLGLFGLMNTNWQKVQRRENWLYVTGDSYKVRIKF